MLGYKSSFIKVKILQIFYTCELGSCVAGYAKKDTKPAGLYSQT